MRFWLLAAPRARRGIFRLSTPSMAHSKTSGRSQTRSQRRKAANAPQPLLSAPLARRSQGSGDRLPPADAAGWADPPVERRHLFVVAARPPRATQDRADRPRGAGPRGCDRVTDAHHPARRALAGKRPVRGLRQGNAPHQRSPRARDALRPHERGNDHRDLPRRREVLQGRAAHPLSYPMEISRRGQATLRRDARARIPDEGFLFLRPGQRGRRQIVQQDVRRLFAHLRPHGTSCGADARRDGPDRRRSLPRIHHPRRDRRVPGLLP